MSYRVGKFWVESILFENPGHTRDIQLHPSKINYPLACSSLPIETLWLMSWIETAVSGRSVCRATECKKNEIKIEKDELRMGTWVEFKERGGWQWKHWYDHTAYALYFLAMMKIFNARKLMHILGDVSLATNSKIYAII
jgi:hypothetical protein